MALRTRYVGEGLGIKPVKLTEPFSPDSGFDSTVRIPIKDTSYTRPVVPRTPALGAAPPPPPPTPMATQPPAVTPPAYPQAPPPIPSPAPVPATPVANGGPGLGGYDPSSINFEGSTFQPGVPATIATPAGDEGEIDRALSDLEGFSGAEFKKNWRQILRDNPQDFMAQFKAFTDNLRQHGTIGNRADTSFRNRIDDIFRRVQAAAQKTTATPNTDYQTQFLGQSIFNNAVESMKTMVAQGAQEEDQQLLALLESRGLLQSGIAAKELAGLQRTRMENLYQTASRLKELLLQNELGRISQRDLATLQADLQKRNNEAYLRLQQKLIEASQPSGLAQFGGAVVGTAIPFLLSRTAPGVDSSSGLTQGGQPEPKPYRPNYYQPPRP